jgi:hypothetical protein
MAHLYIPLDGVPIVPSPPGADYIAADGWIVFSLSDRNFYGYNISTGTWNVVGGAIQAVADTDSVDLVNTSGTVTANVLISTDGAPVGNVKATITVQGSPNPGLLAVVAESDILALFSVADSDSLDLTYTTGQISGNLVLSSDSADANFAKVDLSIKTPSTTPGLHGQVSYSNIRSAITATDTDSIDMSFSSGQVFGDVRLSSDAADAGYTIAGLSIQTGASKGLRAQVQNSAIHGLFSALAPISYLGSGVFAFNTATTALSAYLLKTGGTMTGPIVSEIVYGNATVVTSMLQPAAGAFSNVNHLQATTLSFDATKGECFKFSINAESHAGLEVCAYYKHGFLTILTDQENKYQETHSGSGFYISKGNNTGAILIKSRLGGTHKILITIKEGVLSSATAWA